MTHLHSKIAKALMAAFLLLAVVLWQNRYGGWAERGVAGAAAPIKIKLGWAKFATNSVNYLMAQEGQKYGLDIELVEFPRYTDMRIALENGSLDFGTDGPGDLALSADSTSSNSLVALAGQATGADLLAKRAGIGNLTWSELASGKLRFGNFGAGIGWVKTVATIEERGFDYGKVNDIKIAGGIYDVMQTLKSGGTQVVMDVDPAIAQGVHDGYAQYADELDINKSSLGAQNSLFVTSKKMLERPDVIHAVLKDYVAQLERLQKSQALWTQTYQSFTGIDKSVAEMSLKRIHFSLRFSQEELTNFAKFLVKEGLAKNSTLPETVKDHYVYEPLVEITRRPARELGKSR